ncbi:site-specific integrase [Nocardioides immobilis]|uniref:Site-specific integrase n=1 Tax=Nocardioides immobilis TaxID=2049295 RepID=A0A417XXW7_9ACTN|nr:site-specific integrase [Nocardioides immobilis]RHW25226.1 site-specific integrase [Nocardioides immobilis]
MASIDKRKGKWVVRWRVGGSSRQKTFTVHAHALDHKAKVEAETRAGNAIDPVMGRVLFREWWPIWMRGRVNLKPATLATSRSLYVNHISRWDDWTLDRIRQPEVQTWVAEQVREDRLSSSTIIACYKDFASAMKAAVVARYLRETPCVGVNLPQVERDPMRVLDHDEIARLADAINPQYRALVIFLAYSGLRIGEACALRWSNVDADRSQVVVTHTASEVAGHGLQLTVPKTAAARRTVPLPHHVTEALRSHRAGLSAPWVFTTTTGAQVNPRAFNRRPFATALRRTGITCRVHDLRHTAISHWIRAGVDLPRVKAWAGHTDAAFTLNTYAKFFPTDDTHILDMLNERIITSQASVES